MTDDVANNVTRCTRVRKKKEEAHVWRGSWQFLEATGVEYENKYETRWALPSANFLFDVFITQSSAVGICCIFGCFLSFQTFDRPAKYFWMFHVLYLLTG